MENPLSQVLADILAAAARQGMTAGELARRAGVAPETVSRLRSRGTGDFDTVARLAGAAGLRLAALSRVGVEDAIARGEFF